MPILDFMNTPVWVDNDLDQNGFQELIPRPSAARSPVEHLDTIDTLSQIYASDLVDLQGMDGVIRELDQICQEHISRLASSNEPRTRAQQFFELMCLIYEASHYRHSPTLDFATLPGKSLWLLRNYLHAPQNQVLLNEISQL